MGSFSEMIDLDLPDSDISHYPNFFPEKEASNLFSKLRAEIPWQQDDITLFGKTYAQPRLTALFGNNGKSYSYSNIIMHPHEFTPELLLIKKAVEKEVGVNFTTCLLNLYRDGRDSNGWHSDDEKELGQNPVIASVSLGSERFFHFRHKTNKKLKHKMPLQQGSLLVMKGKTQHFWQHQIPKTAKPVGERINLTFRIIS